MLVHVGVILALTLIKLPEDFFEDFVITTPVEDVDPDSDQPLHGLGARMPWREA